jgi:hypothetical protein
VERLYLNKWMMISVWFVLDQHAELNFCSATSLKQQSTDSHVAPIGYIIQTASYSVFDLTL